MTPEEKIKAIDGYIDRCMSDVTAVVPVPEGVTIDEITERHISLLSQKPVPPVDDNPKTVYGAAKPGISAIPPSAILHLGQAMADGRAKYGLMNWREKTVSSSVYYDAAGRHLLDWWDGEDAARDSLVHHLAHTMACCAILIDAIETGKLNDDRPIAGTASSIVERMTKRQAGKDFA